MSSREVLTLQVGHYSNFIGTHWWNVQEGSFVYDPKLLAGLPKEVSHDVLFREGQTATGQVTYTPRLVLFDLNNSLGSMKKEGTLYDIQTEENIRWVDDVTLHQTQRSKKNRFLQDLEEDEQNSYSNELGSTEKTWRSEDIDEDTEKPSTSSKPEEQVFEHRFYNLDDDVKVWSDYLQTALHPRSTFLLREYQHNNPEQPFSVFGLGQQLCHDKEQWESIEDKVRYFTEECDNLQGFQILLDSHNAFGGLASSVLSYLSDEYSSKSRLSFAVTPACPPDQTVQERSARILCSVLSLHYCSEYSSLYIPLSLASSLWRSIGPPAQFNYLQYKANLDYHTSAIIASALDTMTMPYRIETYPVKMTDITSPFNSLGRKVAALNVSLPFPLNVGSSFADSLMGHGENDPWTSLTPHVKCSSSPLFHCCVIRGITSTSVKRESPPGRTARLLSTCSTVDDVLQLYLSETYPGSRNAGCALRDGIKVGAPFPHIFTPNVDYQGFITDTLRPSFCSVETVPVMTSLQSSTDVYSYIDSLEGCVSKFNISKHQHFIEAGLEPDEFIEVVQNLKTLSQCYKLGDSDS